MTVPVEYIQMAERLNNAWIQETAAGGRSPMQQLGELLQERDDARAEASSLQLEIWRVSRIAGEAIGHVVGPEGGEPPSAFVDVLAQRVESLRGELKEARAERERLRNTEDERWKRCNHEVSRLSLKLNEALADLDHERDMRESCDHLITAMRRAFGCKQGENFEDRAKAMAEVVDAARTFDKHWTPPLKDAGKAWIAAHILSEKIQAFDALDALDAEKEAT